MAKYMIRSKALPLKMRDPGDMDAEHPSGVMKDVGPRQWVGFTCLPAGMSPEGDGDVSVRVIDGAEAKELLALCEAENDRMAGEDIEIAKRRAELAAQREAEAKRKAEEAEKERVKTHGARDIAALDAKAQKESDELWGRVPKEPEPQAPEPMSVEDFVAKHGSRPKPEIVDWAVSLGVEGDGTRAELLEMIHLALCEAGVSPE